MSRELSSGENRVQLGEITLQWIILRRLNLQGLETCQNHVDQRVLRNVRAGAGEKREPFWPFCELPKSSAVLLLAFIAPSRADLPLCIIRGAHGYLGIPLQCLEEVGDDVMNPYSSCLFLRKLRSLSKKDISH